MDSSTAVWIGICFLAIAVLYSSVGHAGASGYLAVMALFSVSPDVMRPTALILNILVATIVTVKFYHAGYFSWPLLWPLLVTSIPFAFIGGVITLPSAIYRPIVGIILLYAAYRLIRIAAAKTNKSIKPFPVFAGLIIGALVGFLSGLTGTGGGIFLSPLFIFKGWAETKQVSAVSAGFILANSCAGLIGRLSAAFTLPSTTVYLAIAVMLGGWIGAHYGSSRWQSSTLRRLLAVVLIIAGLKLIFA